MTLFTNAGQKEAKNKSKGTSIRVKSLENRQYSPELVPLDSKESEAMPSFSDNKAFFEHYYGQLNDNGATNRKASDLTYKLLLGKRRPSGGRMNSRDGHRFISLDKGNGKDDKTRMPDISIVGSKGVHTTETGRTQRPALRLIYNREFYGEV